MQTVGKKAKEAIYLDCAILLPGDILLTADSNPISRAICIATGSEYAHAALIVKTSARLEADGDGIGYTPMPIERAEWPTKGKDARLLHRLPETTLRAVVLRRPGLANGIPDLDKWLSELARPSLWTEYPELTRLASVFKAHPAKRMAVKTMLRLIDKWKGTPTNPGQFCSELVCGIHEALGYQVIPGVRAEEMSAGKIFEAGLPMVSDAITTPDESAALNEAAKLGINAPLLIAFSREVLPHLVEFMKKVKELNERARLSVDSIAVDANAIRAAEAEIEGCQKCLGDRADVPFYRIISWVLKQSGVDFVLTEHGRCPNCFEPITVKTLVQWQVGLDI